MIKKSKNLILSLMLLGLFSNGINSSAQDTPISFGGKAGVTMSSFLNQDPVSRDYTNSFKPGVIISGFGAYNINDMFSAQLEVGFSQFGGKLLQVEDDTRFGLNVPYAPVFTENKVTLNRLYIPVLFKAKLPLDIGGQPVAYIGPDISFNMYSYMRTTQTGLISGSNPSTYSTFQKETEVTDIYESKDFGATLGIGFELDTDFGLLLLDVRYRRGLSTIKQGYSYLDLNDVKEDLKNHSIMITLGYALQ